MSKTENLLIRSVDRIRGTSTDFEVRLPDVLNDIKTVALLNCHIPNTMYNIRLGRNDNFHFFDGSENVATLAPGAYDIITIKNALENAMLSVGSQIYSFVYSQVTMKVTISAPAPFIIRGTQTQNMNYLLGFDSFIDTPSSNTHTGQSVIRLDNPLNIIINIKELNRSFSRTTNDIHGNFIVTTEGNSQDTMSWDRNTNYPLNNAYQSSGITSLNISLKRDNRELLDLNGADWTLLLAFCYY